MMVAFDSGAVSANVSIVCSSIGGRCSCRCGTAVTVHCTVVVAVAQRITASEIDSSSSSRRCSGNATSNGWSDADCMRSSLSRLVVTDVGCIVVSGARSRCADGCETITQLCNRSTDRLCHTVYRTLLLH